MGLKRSFGVNRILWKFFSGVFLFTFFSTFVNIDIVNHFFPVNDSPAFPLTLAARVLFSLFFFSAALLYLVRKGVFL